MPTRGKQIAQVWIWDRPANELRAAWVPLKDDGQYHPGLVAEDVEGGDSFAVVLTYLPRRLTLRQAMARLVRHRQWNRAMPAVYRIVGSTDAVCLTCKWRVRLLSMVEADTWIGDHVAVFPGHATLTVPIDMADDVILDQPHLPVTVRGWTLRYLRNTIPLTPLDE
jgi:hypothetical protein